MRCNTKKYIFVYFTVVGMYKHMNKHVNNTVICFNFGGSQQLRDQQDENDNVFGRYSHSSF